MGIEVEAFGGITEAQHAAIKHNDSMIAADAAIAATKLKKRVLYVLKRPMYPRTKTSSTDYVDYGDVIWIPKERWGLTKAEVGFERSEKCVVRMYEVGYTEEIAEWGAPGGSEDAFHEFDLPYNITRLRLQFKSTDGTEVELGGGTLLCW